MWLAPSMIDGKGIFAGRAFNIDDDLDYAPGIPVPFTPISTTMLINYVHAGPTEYLLDHELEYSLINFGITMIMNHHTPPARTYSFFEEDSDIPINETLTHPYATYPVSWHGTEVDLKPGDEIFNVYSEDGSWFEDKDLKVWDDVNVTDSTPTPLTIERIESTGHCMTQVYFNASDILGAGLGIFASRSFKGGEDITVSPALVLPRTTVEELQITSLLQNYCIATDESEIVLLPIGSSVIANHAMNPNMKIAWHRWSTDAPNKLENILARNVSELTSSRFTELDIVWRASRDIAMGEELTFDYGESWVNAFATYLAEYAIWLADGNDRDEEEVSEESSMPMFRHFIAAPEGMFPEHWNFRYEEEDDEDEDEGEDGEDEDEDEGEDEEKK